ncbi:MAG: hypothetical protein WAO83_04795 [Fuerstiella sp.]|jgi:hypothetical protein
MSTNKRLLIAGAGLLVTIVLGTRGCSQYGEVNALTFAHAKGLYAACNTRQPQRLDVCAAMIDTAESTQQMSATEAGFLREIIAKGKSEKWEEAQVMARKLMADQAK